MLCLLCHSACQIKVEGCMHPKAKNFNPEADEDVGCDYYEMILELQHFADSLPNDTLLLGDTLFDADNNAFYLNSMSILCSGVHLSDINSNTEYKGAEQIVLFGANNEAISIEDNFFIGAPGTYSHNISAWTELGEFDSLHFHLGIPSSIINTDPSRVTENNHPLSTSAIKYMYDSTTTSYLACNIVVFEVNSGNEYTFEFFDYIRVNLPYNITVEDGEDVPIRIRVDYQILFEGISFNNDSHSVIQSKIVQNFPLAFSSF
ncbi:hypothetical protein OAK19_00580 [Aureispira]|nr:hypothetical protein [Aureispira sp.]